MIAKKYELCPARFWKNVDIKSMNECWNWKGNTIYNYHRVAFELVHRYKIPDRKMILHSCNNNICCNPLHLHLGTQKENMQQMMSEGRGNKTSKISKAQAEEIREKYKNKENTQRELAEMYKISFSQIGNIIHNRCWKI